MPTISQNPSLVFPLISLKDNSEKTTQTSGLCREKIKVVYINSTIVYMFVVTIIVNNYTAAF